MNKSTSRESVPSQYILQSVSNALSVMDLLAKQEDLSVSQIAQSINIGKTTAFRLLATLENGGYISKNSKAQYRLSMKLAVLGSVVTARNEIAKISHPFLEELCSCFGETVHLVIWHSDVDIIVADRITGFSPISYQTTIGYVTHPAHIAASGLILLAFAAKEKTERYFKLIKWKEQENCKIATPAQLEQLLKKVKDEQTASNCGDFIPGLYCYAVPVFDHTGHAAASLSIAGPEANLKSQREEMVHRLTACAGQIRQQLSLDFC